MTKNRKIVKNLPLQYISTLFVVGLLCLFSQNIYAQNENHSDKVLKNFNLKDSISLGKLNIDSILTKNKIKISEIECLNDSLGKLRLSELDFANLNNVNIDNMPIFVPPKNCKIIVKKVESNDSMTILDTREND
jgi:hypothetical protein